MKSERLKPSSGPSEITTLARLAERYQRRPLIPLDEVRADWFPHLTKGMFARKIGSGEIALPVMRIEPSQKAPRSVHLHDLAAYINARRHEARRAVSPIV